MTATFHVGDAVTVMNTLPEKSVDLILTSPPFLALRSYLPQDHPDKALEGGLQATPGAYIDWLLDVVEACARVLAPHGSLCFELGDTYSGSGGAGGDYAENGLRAGQPMFRAGYLRDDGRKHGQAASTGPEEVWQVSSKGGTGWPLAKSLSLIPETFRFAMVYGHNPHTGRRTAPWRLRNVIRWVRPNPPVGALGDKFRPATSELMVFCKAKDRFFDLDAVREPYSPISERLAKSNARGHIGVRQESGTVANDEPKIEIGYQLTHNGAPPLDWWQISSGGFTGAHYAVWPPELLVKPIKAMCPEKVCRRCGEPSRRIVEVTQSVITHGHYYDRDNPGIRSEVKEGNWKGRRQSAEDVKEKPSHHQGFVRHAETLGWTDCGHDDWRPGLVLDPFAGSGTTLSVATGHGRDAIGIDLDERNYELALDRVGPLVLTRAA